MSKAQRAKTARREERRVPVDKGAAVDALPTRTGATSWFGYPVVYLLLTVAVADVFTFADPDLWGHIPFGQAMLKAGHMIRYDPYSYSAPGHLWRNHEWLSEVVLALCYNAGGVFGLELLKLVCTIATVLFLALAVAETRAFPAIQSTVVMLTGPAMTVQMQLRPQLFSFALTAALMWLLARDTYRRSSPLWLAVPMLAVWSNFHGGYIAGLGALGTYAAVVSIRGLAERRDWRRAVRLNVIVVASVLATLVNPYGIDAWYAVWRALSNPMTRTLINDWKPLFVAIAGVWVDYVPGAILMAYAAGFLFVLGVAVALTRRGDDLPLIVLGAVFTMAALMSLRNTSLAVIVTSVPLAYHLDLAWRQRRRSGGAGQPVPGLAATAATDSSEGSRRDWFGQLFAATAAILLMLNSLFTGTLVSSMPSPGGAVAFMKKHHLQGNLLSIFNWGEYLIWHLAPETKVFIDGRYDTVYPLEIITQAMDFAEGSPKAEKVLDAYKHDFVMVPPNIGAWQVMSAAPTWKLLYRDENVTLFGPSKLVISGVVTPVFASAPPDVFP